MAGTVNEVRLRYGFLVLIGLSLLGAAIQVAFRVITRPGGT
jgi:hypothetical protein